MVTKEMEPKIKSQTSGTTSNRKTILKYEPNFERRLFFFLTQIGTS